MYTTDARVCFVFCLRMFQKMGDLCLVLLLLVTPSPFAFFFAEPESVPDGTVGLILLTLVHAFALSVLPFVVQNHISVDAEAVLNLMVFQMFIWSALVRLISCIVLLFWVLGVSATSGLSLVFLSLPINKVCACWV